MALKDKNKALRRENRNLLECLSAIETTRQQPSDHQFHVSIPHIRDPWYPLLTSETLGLLSRLKTLGLFSWLKTLGLPS